jgi:hypothetical protein
MWPNACSVVLVAVALFGGAPGRAQEAGQTVPRWWLESGPKLIALDDRAAKLAEIDAGQNLVSVEEAFGRIVVASAGDYTRNTTFGGTREFWPVPGSSSKITVLDAATLAVLASRTVTFNPGWVEFVDANTLVVVSYGQVSGDEKKEILPAVTILRGPKWEAASPIPLKTRPLRVWTKKGGTKVWVACETFKKRPAELVVVDAASGETRSTTLPEDFYATAPGRDGQPAFLVLEKSIVPLDADGTVLAPLPKAGKNLVLFAPLPGFSTYLLGASSGKTGTLQIVNDGKVSRTIELADGLERVVFGPRTHRLYLCGNKVAVALDTETWNQVAKLTIPENVDAQLDAAERRLFFIEGKALSIVDVDGKSPVGRVGFAGGFMQFMNESGAHWQLGEAGAFRVQPRNDVAVPVSGLAIAPSGSHAMTYNPTVNEVSLIDTTQLAVDVKVRLSSAWTGRLSDLWRLPGGDRLLAVRGRRLALFDLEKGTLLADKEFPKSRIGWMSRSGLLFARSPEGTRALSLETLETLHDFGPDTGMSEDALKDDLGLATHAAGRRFAVTTAAGVKMFDFDFKHVGTVEGVKRIDGLYRTGAPAAETDKQP